MTTRHSQYRDSGESDTRTALDMWMDYYKTVMEQGLEVMHRGTEMAFQTPTGMPGWDSFETWMDAYQSRLNPSEKLDNQTLRNMYDAWVHAWAESMERWMSTPEFVAKSGQDLEHFSEFQEKTGTMMNQYWETLHLASARDLHEVFHKLYLMDRKLDDMDKRLRQMMTLMEQNTSKPTGTTKKKSSST